MPTLVHLGVGNFHRAHQAWYTQLANALATSSVAARDDDSAAARDADGAPTAATAAEAASAAPATSGSTPDEEPWRIVGVSLRSPAVRDALAPQDYAYALSIGDASGAALHRVDVVDEILVAPESPGRVIDAIADPAVPLVTLTVTEKGYHLDGEGRLRVAEGPVAIDLERLAAGTAPTTTIGLLVAALARRAASGAPVTLLSCDNLSGNGEKLARALVDCARAASLDLGGFLEHAVACPSCMVDRITPATDEALRARVAATDLPPAAPVATEAFSEWVIEDRFVAARPAWERAGAVFVDDVAPFELRKLRMLNGAHSYLAYAGTLAGHEFVHQAIADAELRAAAAAVMDEAAKTLPGNVARYADDYRAALLERFANPGLAHRLRQIAMDGSEKLPIRILPTIAARAEAGLESPACERALVAWRDFVVAERAAGRDLDDPAAARLARGVEAGLDARALLAGG